MDPQAPTTNEVVDELWAQKRELKKKKRRMRAITKEELIIHGKLEPRVEHAYARKNVPRPKGTLICNRHAFIKMGQKGKRSKSQFTDHSISLVN